jgi:D-alanyl-D-alanine carboxypeptidase (penicillin-binding protein 5/6)
LIEADAPIQGRVVTRLRRIVLGGSAALVLAFATPSAARWSIETGPPYTHPEETTNIPVVLLVDVDSGRTLLQHDSRRRFAPASMAKVMTVFVALEEMKAGRLAPTRKYTVSDATARQWNGKGTSLYLTGRQEIDVDTLLRGIATVSANDASVVLAEGYAGTVVSWCALMNEQARRLGMTDSHFATPNGWPDGGQTYVSARDLVVLADALVRRHPQAYRRYFGQKRMVFAGVEQQSHDPTVGVVRGADGIKTGHTDEAGYNFLGSASRNGQRLIMVIGGAKSEAERAAASRALLEWGFSQWTPQPLFARGAEIAKAQVQNGDTRTVPLVSDRAIAAIRRANKPADRLNVVLIYRGPLVAPIAKGAEVAELRIWSDNAPLRKFPLFAGASVSEAGPIERLVNGLTGLFT